MTIDPKPLRPVIMKVPQVERLPRGRERVRALSRLAREAACQSAVKSGLKLNEFPKNPAGAPIPTDGVHWSISHKTLYVAGVAAANPVGIDIEKLRTVSDGLMEKIADKKEWERVEDYSSKAFLRFWTAKEAVLKAMSVGFTGLSNCRIVKIVDDQTLIATYGPKKFTIHQTWFAENYLASITGSIKSLQWILL